MASLTLFSTASRRQTRQTIRNSPSTRERPRPQNWHSLFAQKWRVRSWRDLVLRWAREYLDLLATRDAFRYSVVFGLGISTWVSLWSVSEISFCLFYGVPEHYFMCFWIFLVRSRSPRLARDRHPDFLGDIGLRPHTLVPICELV